MQKIHGITFWGVLALLLVGCGKPAQNDQSVGKSQGPNAAAGDASSAGTVGLTGPAAAVYEFLDAVRTGNDDKATRMLSRVAREKTAALNRNVTPPASDTARFSVGKVEYVGQDGARVASTWTDLDVDGEPRMDEAVWVVRLEPDGWRVAGVAALVFPGEPLLLLNFEDPEDMFRKQQWVREEIRRRMNNQPGGMQAQGGENREIPVRR